MRKPRYLKYNKPAPSKIGECIINPVREQGYSGDIKDRAKKRKKGAEAIGTFFTSSLTAGNKPASTRFSFA
ncbi:MAG: hypothetical protein P1U52_09570, partial [Porticoccaceae bacterium]|nr:hypothetical protein [Porticoccaceae bacterium]